MAISYKVLGQVYATTAAGWQLLYSVPEDRTSVISSIIFCNQSETANGFVDLAVQSVATAGSVATKEYILFISKILPSESRDFRSSLTLEYGKHLYVRSRTSPSLGGGSNISINVFGSENT